MLLGVPAEIEKRSLAIEDMKASRQRILNNKPPSGLPGLKNQGVGQIER
jgi:hypothetical protein